MKFVIAGAWTYRVRIVRGLADAQGKPIMGRCDEDAQELLIDAGVAPRARRKVLAHEYRHAWQYAVPRPTTDEEEADLSATINAAWERDWRAQGGARALMALRPDEDAADDAGEAAAGTPGAQAPDDGWGEVRRFSPLDLVDPAVSVAPARGGRAQCGRCELIVADGSVVTSPPKWDAIAKGMIVRRTLYCCHCNHLQTWDEGSRKGAPNGAVVRGPTYCTDWQLVEAHLAEHPEAAGVLAG